MFSSRLLAGEAYSIKLWRPADVSVPATPFRLRMTLNIFVPFCGTMLLPPPTGEIFRPVGGTFDGGKDFIEPIGRGRTLVTILREAIQDDALERRRDSIGKLGRCVGLLAHLFHQDLQRRIAFEDRPSGEEPIGDTPEGVNVTLRASISSRSPWAISGAA